MRREGARENDERRGVRLEIFRETGEDETEMKERFKREERAEMNGEEMNIEREVREERVHGRRERLMEEDDWLSDWGLGRRERLEVVADERSD
ncbi:hypothetical protein Tco_0810956 [Tanacetum coccineum]